MLTKNIKLENTNWNDVESLIGESLEAASAYTLTIRGGNKGEVCKAEQAPQNDFVGHPVYPNENFLYQHKSGKLFIKADTIGTIFVIS